MSPVPGKKVGEESMYRCYASSFHFQILHQKSDPDRKIRPCFLFSFFIFLPCSSFSRMEILLEHPLQMSMETETVVARLKASGLLQTKGLIGGKWTNAYDGWSMEGGKMDRFALQTTFIMTSMYSNA
ncbi:hypothetical protein E3N88_15699 [Mikania micrantha]|uniref:Uncharacterized protein n=1 Tax=Mikania micrantha TaxID=192012 RepID=A0A5N6NWB8_9ASTR|nr:hypothetical protein E3N88_15699 [Mikania micrantha]